MITQVLKEQSHQQENRKNLPACPRSTKSDYREEAALSTCYPCRTPPPMCPAQRSPHQRPFNINTTISKISEFLLNIQIKTTNHDFFAYLFGKITGTIRRIQYLIIKYREIESKPQSNRMCRCQFRICNILRKNKMNISISHFNTM